MKYNNILSILSAVEGNFVLIFRDLRKLLDESRQSV